MADKMKCWKIIDGFKVTQQLKILIDEKAYELQTATKEEIKEGYLCQLKWRVVRECDQEKVMQSVPFDELIFCDGKCIGIYHEEIIMLFDDERTHNQKKWLGEVTISHDQSYDVYEYYSLIRIKRLVNESSTDEAQKAYEQAEELYNANKHKESIEWYKKAVELGNVSAMNALGWSYLYGDGVDADMDIAAELFRQALAHGNTKAATNLSVMWAFFGYKIDDDNAFRVAKMGAEAGNINAYIPLAYCYYYGTGCAKNRKLAAYWACRSYEHRDEIPEAYKIIALFYNKGYFFPKVPSMAKYCYQKLAEVGVDVSQKIDTPEFRNIKTVEPFIPDFDDKAPDFFTQECPHAQYTEALQYLGYGDGYAPVDTKKAEELLTKSANQGYANAQYSLGIKYIDSDERTEVRYDFDGTVTAFSSNNELGCSLIRKAADNGNYDAIEAIEFLYYDNIGITMEDYAYYTDLKEKLF